MSYIPDITDLYPEGFRSYGDYENYEEDEEEEYLQSEYADYYEKTIENIKVSPSELALQFKERYNREIKDVFRLNVQEHLYEMQDCTYRYKMDFYKSGEKIGQYTVLESDGHGNTTCQKGDNRCLVSVPELFARNTTRGRKTLYEGNTSLM